MDWEKDAVSIGRRFGFNSLREVLGAAWLAQNTVDTKWSATRGASKRTFFSRQLRRELLQDLPRASVPLARHVVMAWDGGGEEPPLEKNEQMPRWRQDGPAEQAEIAMRVACLPPLQRRVVEEVLRGATPEEIAARLCLTRRRIEQNLRRAVQLLEGERGGGQRGLFGEEG